MTRIAIIGTVGVPASYGGFETLVENLALWHEAKGEDEELIIYCSAPSYKNRLDNFHGAQLRYVPLQANGAQSIIYDIWSMVSALRNGNEKVLVLGVSGAVVLPLVRLISKVRIVTNIDGIEWKRDKWGRLQRWILLCSEALAVRYSHEVIADNGAIAEYIRSTYHRECSVIAYGGDHAFAAEPAPVAELDLPQRYVFNLCRIEPENNVHMMLEACADRTECPLVCIGNWDRSPYGIDLKAKYKDKPGLRLIDPIYNLGKLRSIRANAEAYLHGHSAGGTNPSLVEMMFFGIPVFAFDCDFNRHSTDNRAIYFANSENLRNALDTITADQADLVGKDMQELARARYTWDKIAASYFELMKGA